MFFRLCCFLMNSLLFVGEREREIAFFLFIGFEFLFFLTEFSLRIFFLVFFMDFFILMDFLF